MELENEEHPFYGDTILDGDCVIAAGCTPNAPHELVMFMHIDGNDELPGVFYVLGTENDVTNLMHGMFAALETLQEARLECDVESISDLWGRMEVLSRVHQRKALTAGGTITDDDTDEE